MLGGEAFFNRAESLYHSGKKEDAVIYYLEAIQENPNYIDALINLSVTLIELGRKHDALVYLKRALELDKKNYITLTNYANLLFSLNRADEALKFYLDALAIKPNSLEIKKNIAHIMMSQGRYEDAIIYLKQLVKEDINHKDILLNLTHCLNATKQHREALETILLCHRIYPKDCDVINTLANTFEYLGDINRAENCYKQVVRLQPLNHIYNFNLGLFLKKRGFHEDAINYFRNALDVKGDFQEAMLELGNSLKSLKRYNEAISTYDKLLKITQNKALVLNNIGTTYYEMKQYNKALDFLNQTLRLAPDFSSAYFNRGLVYKDTFEYEKAIYDYRQAIKINNDYPEAHWNLALLLLIKGDLYNGWKHYEWRKKLPVYKPFERHFSQPEWKGEDVKNKTLLLHDEQGFGDAIQFIRYAKLLKGMGAEVIVECLEPLSRLFNFADGVDSVITRGNQLPDFDYHCSLLTLPLRFNTTIDTIPNYTPYIKPPCMFKHKDRDNVFRVGIAWSGINPLHKSCPIKVFFGIFTGLPNVEVFNLQKIISKEDKEFIRSRLVIDDMDKVNDFLDTACIMSDLDLIITIDTSIAHLAGAMGLKVWTILHYDADWRWLLNRKDSPWYPTMRLFRQKAFGDWEGVVEKVNKYLSKHLNSVGLK